MARTFVLEILTPERSFFSDNVLSVIFSAPDGRMSVQAGHERMIVELVPCECQIHTEKSWISCFVSEGFLQIEPEVTVIFTQAAEWPEEIDVRRAQRARERAEERLRQRRSDEEYRRSKVDLARAMARLSLTKRKTRL